jgi:hypothetical protein
MLLGSQTSPGICHSVHSWMQNEYNAGPCHLNSSVTFVQPTLGSLYNPHIKCSHLENIHIESWSLQFVYTHVMWRKGCISLFEWIIGYHCQSLTLNANPVKPSALAQLHYAYSILLIISHGLGHFWTSLSHARECNLASTTHVQRLINTTTQAIMAAEWNHLTETSKCFIYTWNWA